MTAIEIPVLEISRTFNAPATRVFDAWLTREQWQAWIGPEGMDCLVPILEPKIGGRYRVEMILSNGNQLPVTGEFRIIDRPHTLSFSWGWDGDPARQSLITLSFREKDGKTELVLRQEGLGTVANCEDHRRGWNSALNKLERFLTKAA